MEEYTSSRIMTSVDTHEILILRMLQYFLAIINGSHLDRCQAYMIDVHRSIQRYRSFDWCNSADVYNGCCSLGKTKEVNEIQA